MCLAGSRNIPLKMSVKHKVMLRDAHEFVSGDSAVGLARMVRDHEVVGSNPTPPTSFSYRILFHMKRVHAYYTGSVQGIGFRFTAERIAGSLDLTGWVKNLDDGGVEVVCEGKEAPLKDFLDKIDEAFKRYIKRADIEWSRATGEFEDFRIAF